MEHLGIGKLEFVIIILKTAQPDGEIIIILAVLTYAPAQHLGICLGIIQLNCAKRSALTVMLTAILGEEHVLMFALAAIMQTESP